MKTMLENQDFDDVWKIIEKTHIDYVTDKQFNYTEIEHNFHEIHKMKTTLEGLCGLNQNP